LLRIGTGCDAATRILSPGLITVRRTVYTIVINFFIQINMHHL